MQANHGNGWHDYTVVDNRKFLAVDLNTGNEGAITAVDGRLFRISIHRAEKE